MTRRLAILPVTLAVLTGLAGTAAAAAGWTIVPTPNPAGVQQAYFSSVSCTSPSNCVAVGSVYNPPAGPPGLSEIWNGSTWRIQQTATFGRTRPALDQVSCAAATSCMATTGLIATELWNGSTWAVKKLIKPTANGTQLRAAPVSCASPASCVALGSYSINGKCIGVPERWDGSTWAVLATLPGVCATRGGTGVQAISCPTVSSCLAVGYGVAESWNGQTWTSEPPASPGGTATPLLAGVSCPAPGNCTAVGTYTTATGDAALAEHWDGSSWTIQNARNKLGSSRDELEGVSCASAANCVAAGTYYSSSGQVRKTLAEHWNGSTWAIQITPDPTSTTEAELSGVSCPASAATCMAAGFYATPTINISTLAEVSPAE